jgi:hypothetical protein
MRDIPPNRASGQAAFGQLKPFEAGQENLARRGLEGPLLSASHPEALQHLQQTLQTRT